MAYSKRTFLRGGARFALNAMQRRRYASYAAGAVMRRAAQRWRVRKGGVRVAYKKKYSSSRMGLLGGTNADTRMVYRKKSMPRFKKKQWRSFVRKVNAISEKELGSRTVLYNDLLVQNVTDGAKQACLTVGLYGIRNNTHTYLNDLNDISTFENEADPTAAAGGTVDNSTKVIFQSAVMDLTLRNSSTFRTIDGETITEELDGRAAMELDVYEISVRKEAADRTTNFNSISAMLNAYDLKEINNTGNGFEIQDRGCTPFEMGNSMGRFGFKIWKKTKYFIPNNQTITHQIRDPKRRVCTYGEMKDFDGFNKPGWTRLLYFVYKLVPGLTVGLGDKEFQLRMFVGNTRTYKYKIEGFNEDRERLLGTNHVINNPAA